MNLSTYRKGIGGSSVYTYVSDILYGLICAAEKKFKPLYNTLSICICIEVVSYLKFKHMSYLISNPKYGMLCLIYHEDIHAENSSISITKLLKTNHEILFSLQTINKGLLALNTFSNYSGMKWI